MRCANRPVASVDPLGNTFSTVYDAASRNVEQIDALGRTGTTVYDNANRVVATVDPLGNRTSFGFDAPAASQHDERARVCLHDGIRRGG